MDEADNQLKLLLTSILNTQKVLENIVKADNQLKLLLTSILNTHKVFENIVMLSIGI